MLGLCAVAGGDYHLRSNREAGEGRFDIQMEPKRAGLPGLIVEAKLAGEDEAAARGLGQIRDKGYAAELRARGAARRGAA